MRISWNQKNRSSENGFHILILEKKSLKVSEFKKKTTFWLVVSIPLKNMKVNWDDVIPNIWKNNPLMFQTSNQLLKFQQFTEKMEDPRGSSGSHDSMGAISLSSLAM